MQQDTLCFRQILNNGKLKRSVWNLGFQSYTGSEDAITHLVHFIKSSWKKKKIVIIVSLDALKAYDKVYLPKLIQNIHETIGDGPMFRLMANILMDRKMILKIGDNTSRLIDMLAGVPQGGTLSSELYKTDVCQEANIIKQWAENYPSKISGCFYADDNYFLLAIKDPRLKKINTESTKEDIRIYQNMIDAITMTANRAGRIYHKTQCTVFYPEITKGKQINNIDIKDYLSTLPIIYWINTPIPYTTNPVVCLGMTLDCNLNYKTHIEELASKVSKRVTFLEHISRSFWKAPKATLRIVWNNWINTKIDYGNFIWGNVEPNMIKPLEQLQRKAAAAIIGVHGFLGARTAMIDEAEIQPIRIRILERAAKYGTCQIESNTKNTPGSQMLEKFCRRTKQQIPSKPM